MFMKILSLSPLTVQYGCSCSKWVNHQLYTVHYSTAIIGQSNQTFCPFWRLGSHAIFRGASVAGTHPGFLFVSAPLIPKMDGGFSWRGILQGGISVVKWLCGVVFVCFPYCLGWDSQIFDFLTDILWQLDNLHLTRPTIRLSVDIIPSWNVLVTSSACQCLCFQLQVVYWVWTLLVGRWTLKMDANMDPFFSRKVLVDKVAVSHRNG